MDIQPSTKRRSGCPLNTLSACRRLQLSVFISVITVYLVYIVCIILYILSAYYKDYLNISSVNGDFEENSNGFLAEKVLEQFHEEYNETQAFNVSILSRWPRYYNGSMCITRYCQFGDLLVDGFALNHLFNQTQISSRNKSRKEFKSSYRCESSNTTKLDQSRLRVTSNGSILVIGHFTTRFCLDFVVDDDSILVHWCKKDTFLQIDPYYEFEDGKCMDMSEPLLDIMIIRAMTQSTSTLCMIAIIIIYASTRMLLNIHGKIIILYLVSFMMRNIYEISSFAYLKIYGSYIMSLPTMVVKVFSTAVRYSLITWMYIMCFDIWFVFSHPLNPHPHLHHDNGRFMLYSIGAWNSIVLHTILHYNFKGIYFKRSLLGVKLVFTIFVVILNSLMFLATLYNIRFHNVNLIVSNRHGHSAKSFLQLYTRLYFLMGVDWLVALTCEIFGGDTISFVGKLIVDSQGFILFILLVCNRRMISLLRKKYIKGDSENL